MQAHRTCAEVACDRPLMARGQCQYHYHKQRRSDPAWKPMERLPAAICRVPDCGDIVTAHKLCNRHLKRWMAHGTTELLPRATTPERFWAKVDKNGPVSKYAPHLGPCWIWTGAISRGYGSFYVAEGHTKVAHRIAYLWLVGQVPPDRELDHLCRVPSCVRPSHLEAVTRQVNQLRGYGFSGRNARKTHCRRGHRYDEANTYLDRAGHRYCRACNNARARERGRRLSLDASSKFKESGGGMGT